MRDVKLFEGALGRMTQTAFGKELYSNEFLKAGALLEAIANHHPFIDGNKRTSLAAAEAYLQSKKLSIDFTNEEYETFMLHVVNDRPSVKKIAAWLEEHCQS